MDTIARHATWAICGALLACGQPPADPDEIVTGFGGRVTDQLTGEAISGAIVTAQPLLPQQVTDQNGAYRYDSGVDFDTTYTVTVSKTGGQIDYETATVSISVAEGEFEPLNITMERQGAVLSVTPETVNINPPDNAGIFTIDSASNEVLQFTCTSANAWVTGIDPTSGVLSTIDVPVTVTIDRSQLPDGTGNVSGTVVIATDAGSATAIINVTR